MRFERYEIDKGNDKFMIEKCGNFMFLLYVK